MINTVQLYHVSYVLRPTLSSTKETYLCIGRVPLIKTCHQESNYVCSIAAPSRYTWTIWTEPSLSGQSVGPQALGTPPAATIGLLTCTPACFCSISTCHKVHGHCLLHSVIALISLKLFSWLYLQQIKFFIFKAYFWRYREPWVFHDVLPYALLFKT